MGHNCGTGRAPGVVFPGRCWRLRFWMFWLVRAVFCRRGAPAVLPHWFGLVEARSEHNCGTGRAPGVVFPGRRWRLRLWMFRMVRAVFCRQGAPAVLPHWVGLVAALQGSVWALFAAPVGAILHVNNDRMSRSNSGRTSSCSRSSSNVYDPSAMFQLKCQGGWPSRASAALQSTRPKPGSSCTLTAAWCCRAHDPILLR